MLQDGLIRRQDRRTTVSRVITDFAPESIPKPNSLSIQWFLNQPLDGLYFLDSPNHAPSTP
jgi:hypothetical protein